MLVTTYKSSEYTKLDRLCAKISWWMPKRLVYFCAIRLGALATTGIYGSTVVPELTFIEALKRWEK